MNQVILCVEHGVHSTTDIVKLLRKKGFSVFSTPHFYRDHSRVWLRKGTKQNVRNALRVLKEYGYIKTIAEHMRQIF